MFVTTGQFLTILRNYLIFALLVIVITLGLTDIFTHPNRLQQQQHIEHYGRYFRVGLVNTLQQLSP